MFFPLRTDVPLRHTPWMNWALILLNFVVHLWSINNPSLASRYELNPQHLRLLNYFTYALLHANVAHLLSNMLFLYIFGNNVNDRLGHLGYLAFYLAGGVVAGMAHMATGAGPVIGASGAVFAVTGAFLILFPRSHITIFYVFIMFGVIEIASMWFILAYLLINVMNQFWVSAGPAANVAYMAHIGGALFGIALCTLFLAIGLLPRDPFDIIAMADRWNRRRQYRGVVASGYDPFNYVPAAKRGPPDPRQEKIQDLRAEIAEAMSHSDMPLAVKRFMEIRAMDPAQVLSRQNQLDLANHLFEQQHHAAAADAYEGFTRMYPKADQIGHVQLMLGILFSRYLNRTDKAIEHLTIAVDKLRNAKEVEMAREELAHLQSSSAT